MGNTLSDVGRQLGEHWATAQDGADPEELLTEAVLLPDLEQRVTFVKKLLQGFKPQPNPQAKTKTLDGVKNRMKLAEAASAIGDLDSALADLNWALTRIPKADSDLLRDAFVLRASALLDGRHFKAASKDAVRALSLATPEDVDLQTQLNKILHVCSKYSQQNKGEGSLKDTEAGDSENAPGGEWLAMAATNPMVPCASDALLLVDGSFVAARDIKPGEVLLVEEPLASFVELNNSNPANFVCGFCFKTVIAPLPCDGCPLIVFCDEECKEAAEASHSKKCHLLPQVAIDEAEAPLLRTLWLLQNASATNLSGTQPDKELGISKPLRCGDPNALLLLMDRSGEDAKQTVSLAIGVLVLMKAVGLEEQLPPEEVDRLVAAVVRLLPCVHTAASEVKQLVLQGGHLGQDVFASIGDALYPILSLVAPSCAPNALAFNSGHKSVLVATRLIKEGAVVTRCVHPRLDFLRSDLARRRSFLSYPDDGGAVCECEACVLEWPTLDKLQACPDDPEARMLAASKLDERLLPFALSKAEEMERNDLQHTREFHLLQERIRVQLAKQGNVCQARNKKDFSLGKLAEIFSQL